MPDFNPNELLLPTVLDRLIDPEPEGRGKRGYTVEQMFQRVQRDLEDLLNTRQTSSDLPAEFVELTNSVYSFGLPDLQALNALSSMQREEIGHVIEKMIERFEPRLRDIKATLVGGRGELEHTLRFRIDARLRLDPAPEVAFDTILELMTGQYSVKSSAAV